MLAAALALFLRHQFLHRLAPRGNRVRFGRFGDRLCAHCVPGTEQEIAGFFLGTILAKQVARATTATVTTILCATHLTACPAIEVIRQQVHATVGAEGETHPGKTRADDSPVDVNADNRRSRCAHLPWKNRAELIAIKHQPVSCAIRGVFVCRGCDHRDTIDLDFLAVE